MLAAWCRHSGHAQKSTATLATRVAAAMLAPVQRVLGKAPRRLIPNAGHSLLNVCMVSRRVQTLRLAPEILYSLVPASLALPPDPLLH